MNKLPPPSPQVLRTHRRAIFWLRLLLLLNALGYLAWLMVLIGLAQHGLFKLMLGLGNLLFSAALITWQWPQIRQGWRSNQVRWTIEQSYRLVIICLIVALLNWHAYNFKGSIDLSGIGIFQLSKESQQVLAKINGQVDFIVFGDFAQWEPLLRLYKLNGKDKIRKIDKVDPALRPELVQQYSITRPGTLVVLGPHGFTKVERTEELAITNALIKVSREHAPRVAYTIGHGELDLNKTGPDGGSYLLSLLKQANLAVEPLALAQTREISPGIDTILLLGPLQDLHEAEIAMLQKYWQGGGNLVLALNPTIKKMDHNPRLRRWLRQIGLAVDNTLVIDRIRAVSGSNGVIPLVEQTAEHPITANLGGDIFFPVASAIVNLKSPEELAKEQATYLALANTLPFPASWADRRPWELAQDFKLKYNQGEDIPGPITLAAAFTQGQSKLAIFGTANLWQNNYQAFSPNYALLLNALAWQTEHDLIGEFNLIVGENRPLDLRGWQLRLAFGPWAVGLPLLLLGVAVVLYVRRRSL